MQVSPPHSQRQLISGKIGWGWRQATYPISTNFGFTGLLMLVVAIAQLVRVGESSFLAIVVLLLCVGLAIGLYTAKSVVEVCRQNSDYAFSQWQVIGITVYWLFLVVGLSNYSVPFAKNLVAIWWILPAAIFTGISSALLLRSVKSNLKNLNTPQNTEIRNNEDLNVVTYSDQTVLVSPSSLAQQPRQFNSLVLIVLGFFFWTMLDFAASIRAIAAIACTMAGLTGFFTWQIQLRSPEKSLYLRFSGLWGIDSEYLIDLRPFSRLAVMKLQEANGELSWTQLAGINSEITLPLAMTMLTSQIKEDSNENDQLGKILREEFHLAKQETESDSLGLAHVLLPQGAGILAGTVFMSIGGLTLIIFPLAPQLSVGSAIAWLGICILSPAIARLILKLVATNSLQCDRVTATQTHLKSWEIGTALLIISSFLATLNPSKIAPIVTLSQSLPLITLICGWLSIGVGVCIFTFVRRTPLWNKNY